MLLFGWRGRPTLARILLGCLAAAAIWLVVYGIKGYQLGNPPSGAIPACFHRVKIDFVIPMYKPVAGAGGCFEP